MIRKHALKNALIPVVTVIGLQFGSLLGGIKSKDAPMVLGCIVMLTITFSVINLIVDLLYAYIDPRIKAQYKKK